jgi:hypothetical protein
VGLLFSHTLHFYLQEQHTAKRVKEHGDFNLEDKNEVPPREAAAQAPPPTTIPTATATVAETDAADGSPLFSFPPLNLSPSSPMDAGNLADVLKKTPSFMGLTTNYDQQSNETAMLPSFPSMGMVPPAPHAPKIVLAPAVAPSHVVVSSAALMGPVPQHLNIHTQSHHNHTTTKNSDNNHSNNKVPSAAACPASATPDTSGSATNAVVGNPNATKDTKDNNDKVSAGDGATDPIVVLSTFLLSLQNQVQILQATSNVRANEFFNLAAANIAIKKTLQSMALEWKKLVSVMQGAVREHTGKLAYHTESIQFFQEKLIAAEMRAQRDQKEISNLKSQVESMGTSVAHLTRLVESQQESRRILEGKMLT